LLEELQKKSVDWRCATRDERKVSSSRPSSAPPRRTRHDPRRDATHRRLLDAAREIMRESGLGGLSKAELCRRAGIHRSGFYAHFPDVESVAVAVAEEVSNAVVARDAEIRHSVEAAMSPGPEASVVGIRKVLQAYLNDPDSTVLALVNRSVPGPLGDVGRRAVARQVEMLAEELYLQAVQAGLRTRSLDEMRLLARFVCDAVLSAVLLLHEQPDQDLEKVATVTGEAIFYGVSRRIARLIREQA
jgi:AcrR family transcriptional regulator